MATDRKRVEEQVDANIQLLKPLLKRSDTDKRPVALMLCGIAGSGKSTHAKAVAKSLPEFQRFSIDGVLAERHGIYGIDYPREDYHKLQDEADAIFLQSVQNALTDGTDIILDRSFYAKEDRDFYRDLVEKHGGRCVLVHLKAPKEVLWKRILARRAAGITADSALEIDEKLLDFYHDGFEIPNGEDEVVFESQ